MLLHWTTDLINDSLTGLTPKQLAALDLAASFPTKANPGLVRLKKLGFEDAADFATALESARAHVKRYFGVRGVRRVSDLDFEEPGRSTLGRIRERVCQRKVLAKAKMG